MTKITHEEHQFNAVIKEGDTVALTINGEVVSEYTVKVENKGQITFMYEEVEDE